MIRCTRVLLLMVAAGCWSTAAAEIYRFPATYWHGIAHFSGDVRQDGRNVVIDSVAAQDNMDKLNILFEPSNPTQSLIFPDSIVAVYAVKPIGEGISSVLTVQLNHDGGGSYSAFDPYGGTAWWRKHKDAFLDNQIVLERFDEFYGPLRELNGVGASVDIKFRFDDQEIAVVKHSAAHKAARAASLSKLNDGSHEILKSLPLNAAQD